MADDRAYPRWFPWIIATIICLAIAISYLDRQTLPWAIRNIQADIPISNQAKAVLDSAFLVTYGLMYLGGGWLLDRLGTRVGFIVIMIFWSLACASHALATGVAALAVSRLLLGMGEGGSFPAATRAVAEWFSPDRRALAMGIINGGTAVGAVAAPPLIALILNGVGWFGLASWRWVFLLTGAAGLVWVILWRSLYFVPVQAAQGRVAASAEGGPTLADLLRRRQIVGLAGAKLLSDGAWYFYLFWLPKYLFDAHGLDLKQAASIGWIPYAAAGVGCLVGGWLSGRLLRAGRSIDRSRKLVLGLSAACMPWVMLVPHMNSLAMVMLLFSLAFFGQQSWSTLIMTLPTDLVPRAAVGKFAGVVGMGGAFGGILMGQIAGWLLDHGYSYTPVLLIAGLLHLLAFGLLCAAIPKVQQLVFEKRD